MWVTKFSKWNIKSTSLERFFIERIIQRCDDDETISKKHRTINGYTQLIELIKLAELSKKRIRTLRTLIAIIKESKSKYIKQNIVNDILIEKYFNDLKVYIQNFNEDEAFKNDSLDRLGSFIHELKKFSIQLNKYYYGNLIIEMKSIDFIDCSKFERTAKNITKLVDIAIPYFLHKGYSINTFTEVLRRWIDGKSRINLNKFLKFFDHSSAFYEIIVFLGNNANEVELIKEIVYKDGIGDIRKAREFSNDFNPSKYFNNRDEVIYYTFYESDHVSFIRNTYNKLLKKFVINRDRKSLSIFTNFFKNCYWRKMNSPQKFYKNLKISSDPVSVVSRKSTLFISLINNVSLDFTDNTPLDFLKNEQLERSIYYYNLALGTKSIENSLSLLWTSIESILPYRTQKADIECVRDIFSKVFSFGSVCRDIQYLIKRIIVVNKVNSGCFKDIGVENLPENNTGDDLKLWFEWLISDPVEKFDAFNLISGLLAFEYLGTIKPIIEGKLSFFLDRISASKYSIEFQLQRIYLHRNQIVHSGDYINEYTNLWIHLEWYIGKFLYFIILNTELNNNFKSMETLFRNLESDFEYSYSYLEKNKNKLCLSSQKIIDNLLEIDWQ